MSIKEMLDLLEGYFAGMIVEADLELIKDSPAPKEIETNPKTLREPNWSGNLPLIDLDGEVMEICGNEASITNDNHLLTPSFPVYSNSLCIICLRIVKVAPESTNTHTR